MKRKTSTAPTRIYSYGCLAPTEGAEVYYDQLWRAHRYRNKLVEIDRRRRERVAAAQRAHDALGPLLAVVDSTEVALAEARLDCKSARSGRGEKPDLAGLLEYTAAVKSDLGVLYSMSKFYRAHARGNEVLKIEYASIQEQTYAEVKVARNAKDKDGIREAPQWGTYLTVEKAVEASAKAPEPPRFLRFQGEGRVAVQIIKGMTLTELESGEDTRLQLLPAPPLTVPVPPPEDWGKPGGRRRRDRAIAYSLVSFFLAGNIQGRADQRLARMRVGSNGRAPIWTSFFVTWHRDLPADAKIMWAWVSRKREGAQYRYAFQLTVEADSFSIPARSGGETGIVAVDIGSRDIVGGPTRAACWLDGEGDRGYVELQTTRQSSASSRARGRRRAVPNDLSKAESLQGIRDERLDALKMALAGYKVTSASKAMPTETRELLKGLASWRSWPRMVALRRRWQRHEGDAEVYEMLERELKQDRHLLRWETCERRRHSARRRARYQEWAVALVKKYATVVLAVRDYRRAKWAPEDAVSTRAHKSRIIMRDAAPGELREEIIKAAKSYGSKVIHLKLKGDTAWALDHRVCERMLTRAASGEVAEDEARALAKPKAPENHVNSNEPWKRRRLGTKEKRDPLAKLDVSV